jgi:AcrR family transcriptional regulator
MPTKNIIKPQQQRSQDTQRKLMAALHFCLKEKFFEHISIKELASHAGVSVGTFYRRFKDKESLLPLLYQDFGNELNLWVTELESRKFTSLEQALNCVCHETQQFLVSKQCVFRTLHLNSRLHSEILVADKVVDRKQVYRRLATLFVTANHDSAHLDEKEPSEALQLALLKADTAVYIMVNTLLDKVLYPTLTPAIACELDAEAFGTEIAIVLFMYLNTKQ